jgi:hypothetical protein
MISPIGIVHIQRTVRDIAPLALLALALTSCTPPVTNGFDENRPLYTVSSPAVEVSSVELTFESCSLAQQCDLIVQISNKSNRCIAFNQVELPRRDHVLLDTSFNLPRRITGYPAESVRQTFIVLQPREEFRQAVDLHAIYDVSDLGGASITFTTGFFECTAFTGGPSEWFDLVSGPITFERTP